MRKVLLTSVVVFLLSCVTLLGCSINDPVQDDLLKYVNVEMPKILELDSSVITKYESVSGNNYVSDDIVYDKIVNEILPVSRELIKQAEGIIPATQEVREVHELYLSSLSSTDTALTTIVAALANYDYNGMTLANEKLSQSRRLMRDYQAALKVLADKVGVELANPAIDNPQEVNSSEVKLESNGERSVDTGTDLNKLSANGIEVNVTEIESEYTIEEADSVKYFDEISLVDFENMQINTPEFPLGAYPYCYSLFDITSTKRALYISVGSDGTFSSNIYLPKEKTVLKIEVFENTWDEKYTDEYSRFVFKQIIEFAATIG